jgi:signal transduction histidine kinase
MTSTITLPTPGIAEAISITAVLAVLVVIFLSVQQRRGSGRVRLWAYAWGLTFLHFVTRILVAHAGRLVKVAIASDYALLELAGLVFIASFVFSDDERRKRNLLLALLGVPIVIQSFAMYCLDQDPWLQAAAFACLFFGAAAFLFIMSRRTFAQLAGAVALTALGILGVWQLLAGNGNMSVGLILMLAYGLCGPLFWKLYRRRSLGVIIVTAGFYVWAAQFPLTVLVYAHGSQYLFLLDFWNVPRLCVALGMMLTVTEDNLKVIEQGQARAQAITRLLDRLSQLKSRLLAGKDTVAVCGEVAFAVTEASDFTCAALLLVGEEGKLYVAGSNGFTAESLAEMRNQAGDDLAASLKYLSEDGARIGNQSFVLCPEDHLVLIPLVSGRGTAVGYLCVAGGKEPGAADHDQILRLEAFASDLAVNIENMKLRQHLIRSEKLAAIGQLVAGVAHELNNPLTGIIGYADLLGQQIQEAGAARRIEKLGHEAQRMKRILDGLLRFGRQNGSTVRSARFEDTLRDVLLFREYHMRAQGIKVDVQIDPLMPPVGVGEDELKQVLLNILNNAMDAVQEGAQREIYVRGSHKSGRVMVQFEDSGTGFADVNRAFDPFYTTKAPGKGTGLGLSVCYGIVQDVGGEITIENLQPCGARVTIALPAAVSQPVVISHAC